MPSCLFCFVVFRFGLVEGFEQRAGARGHAFDPALAHRVELGEHAFVRFRVIVADILAEEFLLPFLVPLLFEAAELVGEGVMLGFLGGGLGSMTQMGGCRKTDFCCAAGGAGLGAGQRRMPARPSTPNESTSITMAAYKEPTFQERAALAQKAREKALKKLADKPAADPAMVAERTAARLAKEAAAAQKAATRKAAIVEAKAEKLAAAAQAAADAEAAKPVVLTEAEKKAARDARYAARKKNKR